MSRTPHQPVTNDMRLAREAMLHDHLRARGIRDPRILEAFAAIPREDFIPLSMQDQAYDDNPLRIDCGQTISQPYIVAEMTRLLELAGDEKILEVGTGSGFQAAVLGLLSREVHSVERHAFLATGAEDRLEDLGIHNVRVHIGDGSTGWPDCAPYDRILVTCAMPDMPATLVAQLAEGGRIVAPVGGLTDQKLVIGEKRNGNMKYKDSVNVRFVPMVGEEGFAESEYREATSKRGGWRPGAGRKNANRRNPKRSNGGDPEDAGGNHRR